ncbi:MULTISPECIES: DUF819 family protein [Roseivirga]|uniref:DUF819 family protein n=1 Tax=Roseivirga spongicola TaxID=333140 RepID=A0A150X548_9BACT|nr:MULTISPECIES: DUF819 family protein [Roseivirga]KYG73772.1 hypothetical protein AWW68_13920 [Roseivirga spongicola]MBO6660059.1 DUF819 family protein [Roseivirga sp.]MBO6762063.1 DUF819 family protein [Roseivirga sp.]MBO6907204.1 DUF819 family protein [Roseivirga sp.]WPZ09591.1 DUF819 family protein [Roseivirga spongicola]
MPYFTNDAIVLGLLIMVVAWVFYTSSSQKPFWKKFYTFVPSILLCYFLPALLNWPFGLIDGEESNLYFVASRYLLPASLVLLCLSIDLKGILNLGPKAIIMFLAATFGIVLGGPLAILLISTIAPSVLDVGDGQEVWRGLTTVAGSWIGGGANQASMKEIFEVGDDLFATMIVVDVICANIWTGFLLYGASITKKIDAWLKSDTSAIDDLKSRVEKYQASIAKIPTLPETYVILALAFGGTALAHWGSDVISPMLEERKEWLAKYSLESLASGFFWLVVIATTIGVGLSFTKFRKYEGAGASRLGSVFIFILVATIGMKMNIQEIFDNMGLFLIGITWMLFHVIIMIVVAKLVKAPFFFVAVGSQANVGGAASAPVVASAFSPALAPVGVLLAVLGYALGTYGALLCAWMMERASMF